MLLYGERSIGTLLDMKMEMRERFCQNGYKEVLRQDHDNSGRETRVDRINKGVVELREGMEKIKSLFSQWKESSPNPNKVGNNGVKTPMTKDETLKTEHAKIRKVKESLSENMENHEEEELELIKHVMNL